ncbi:ATP-binding cassette domain-containing protein [Virgibacillus sp. W0430]|uniref:ATP-binding cassette domain-containing protein n=1 Tax=Virgibacillus sp. W0430 TaxID=3391580 RepID=UPI003F481EC6
MKKWVSVENVQKKIDSFELGPIDFVIEPGTITALVGSNGSGKSTLLKLLINLAKQDTGTIVLFDKQVSGSDESWKKHVTYLAQTTVGFNTFTGEALRDLISRWYPNWDEASFRKIVQQLDISLTKRFSKMSQGAQQKLMLALAIARNTELLILDEPTSFLDIPSKRAIIDLLVNWMEQGERSIILATHQSEDIKKLADYIIVLNDGKSLGMFEKETLTEGYQYYWFHDEVPSASVPGEIARIDNRILSNQPEATELHLEKGGLPWSNRTGISLEEAITRLLTNNK